MSLATFHCSACQQIGEVDLRELDRHRGVTIESPIPLLSRGLQPWPAFKRLLVSQLFPLNWHHMRTLTYKLTWAEIEPGAPR
jgi:hypothetical protein